MTKLFAILIGLSFAVCCLALNLIQPLMHVIYSQRNEGVLPTVTIWAWHLNPWLKALALIGLIYPVILLFKKNVRLEGVLVYGGVVFLAGTILMFFIATALIVPFIRIL